MLELVILDVFNLIFFLYLLQTKPLTKNVFLDCTDIVFYRVRALEQFIRIFFANMSFRDHVTKIFILATWYYQSFWHVSRKFVASAWNPKIKFANLRESVRTCQLIVTLVRHSVYRIYMIFLFREKKWIDLLSHLRELSVSGGNSCDSIRNSRFVEARLSTRYGTIISNQRALLVRVNTSASRVRGSYSSMIARWSATVQLSRFDESENTKI